MATFDMKAFTPEGGMDDEKNTRKMASYLYQLTEQLRFVLQNLDDENLSEGLIGELNDIKNNLNIVIGDVSGVHTEINQTSEKIELKADKAVTDALGNRVANAESALSVQAEQIELKADKAVTDALGNRVSNAESALSVQAGQIATKVSQTDLSSTLTNYSTLTQTADSITAAVDGIRVGGANMLHGTSITKNILHNYAADSAAHPVYSFEFGGDYPDKAVRIYRESGVTTETWAYVTCEKMSVGKEYTFSADVAGYGHYISIITNGTTRQRYVYSGTRRLSVTFVCQTSTQWLSIVMEKNPNPVASAQFYFDINKLKLEEGNKATAWCQADDELINSAMTIDTNGIRMTGGTIDMQAGTAFKVKSGGTVQIDASSADNSYINLGDGNFSASKDGGVVAEAGHFGTSLDVKGKRVLTEADVDRKIVVSTSQPSGHNLIWLKPSSVTNVSRTAYTASSRDASIDFYRQSQNKITRSFTSDGNTLPNGASYTYTITIPIYSVSANMTDFRLAIYFGNSAGYIYLSQSNIVLTPWHQTNVTFTTTSSTNMCASTSAISVLMEGTKNGSALTTNVYLQKDTTMTLTCSASGGSGTQACSVYYVP